MNKSLDNYIVRNMRIIKSKVDDAYYLWFRVLFGDSIRILCMDLNLEEKLENEILNTFIEDKEIRDALKPRKVYQI